MASQTFNEKYAAHIKNISFSENKTRISKIKLHISENIIKSKNIT
jgi:hypothetical protein